MSCSGDPLREGAQQSPQRVGMETGGRQRKRQRGIRQKLGEKVKEKQSDRKCEGKGKTREMRESASEARSSIWTPVPKLRPGLCPSRSHIAETEWKSQ